MFPSLQAQVHKHEICYNFLWLKQNPLLSPPPTAIFLISLISSIATLSFLSLFAFSPSSTPLLSPGIYSVTPLKWPQNYVLNGKLVLFLLLLSPLPFKTIAPHQSWHTPQITCHQTHTIVATKACDWVKSFVLPRFLHLENRDVRHRPRTLPALTHKVVFHKPAFTEPLFCARHGVWD